MKVIGINASPRKKGNTATLVGTVLRAAEQKGAEVRLVNLRELQMNPCIHCDGCKKELGTCVQKDDLSPLLQDLMAADAIVLGTPVYWWHLPAQTKMLTDRFYCYFLEDTNPETGEVKFDSAFPGGKKFVVVTSRADNEPAQLFPELYDHLSAWLTMLTTVLGAASTEYVIQHGSHSDRDSASQNADLIARAASVGAALV